jgi:hypothetical protein
MPLLKSVILHDLVLLFGIIITQGFSLKQRPLVFVLCLKGFRWDLPHIYSHLPHIRHLARTGSMALWMESELGGSQTNILSLMSGLHVEYHARHNFIETIPVLNEHIGGHTRLFNWPWFDGQRNQSSYAYLRSGRKRQPEIIESYQHRGRMTLQHLSRSMVPMVNSLIDDDDRTNLIMSFIDEPFRTLIHHGLHSDSTRRTMFHIDRLIGRLMSLTSKNNINLIIHGDHGFEEINCRHAIHLDRMINTNILKEYIERSSGTSFSYVLYPKTGDSLISFDLFLLCKHKRCILLSNRLCLPNPVDSIEKILQKSHSYLCK